MSDSFPHNLITVDTEEVKASEELLDRAATSGANVPEAFNAKAFRRSLNKTGRYTRQPTNDKESLALMDDHGVGYSLRGLVAQMKENGGVWQQVRSCECMLSAVPSQFLIADTAQPRARWSRRHKDSAACRVRG
jgi:hypothetical protein